MSSPPTRVWLLRHAETADPTVFHGAESDVGLGEVGHRQALAVAEWLRPLRPGIVMCSGMRRAVETALPIAEGCGVAHVIEPGLHERRVGELSGTAFSSHQGPWAETVRQWTGGNTGYTTPGAESYDELRDRVVAAWDRAISGTRGGRAVVVAHGVVCKVLLLTLLDGWGPRRWADLGRVANCAVSELVGGGGVGWRAERVLFVPDTVPAAAPMTTDAPFGTGPRSEA